MTKVELSVIEDLQRLRSELGQHIDECRKGIDMHRHGEFLKGTSDDSNYLDVRMERLRNLSHFQADVMQIIDKHVDDVVKRYNLTVTPEDGQSVTEHTPSGNILARKSPNKDYPGIIITIDSDKRPESRDIALIEHNRELGGYNLYVWNQEDIYDEYTEMFEYPAL